MKVRVFGFVIVLAGTLIARVVQGEPATWYVANGGNDANDGTSWASALATISNGVAKANGANNDIVLVSNGLYTLTAEIVVNKAITVQGLTGARDSIVDGSASTRCFNINSAGAVVSGLTIRNGSYNGNGGGVYLSSGTVTNCTITGCFGNTNSGYGGGVYLAGGTLWDCDVSSNAAYFGGGISGGTAIGCRLNYNWGTYGGGGAYNATLISNCTITANWAVNYYGGGLLSCVTVVDSTIAGNRAGLLIPNGGGLNGCTLVRNCVISNNTAIGGSGGGAYNCSAIENSTIVGNSATTGGGAYQGAFRNCLIVGNSAVGSWGGGLAQPSRVENCTIVRNRAAGYGAGIYGVGPTTNSIVCFNYTGDAHSNYYASAENFSYCLVMPLPVGASFTNFTFDPGFVDAGAGYGTNDYVAGDYRLRDTSLCLNRGTNLGWMATGTDRDGQPRLYAGGIVDIGAYEFQGPPGNQLPTVSITSPINGAVFPKAPTNITIEAAASDMDGTVTNVAFYQDGTLLGNDTNSPFSYAWSGVAMGRYALTAVACDNGGAVATSAVVRIQVGPTIWHVAPAGVGGSDTNSGMSWASPLATISNGVAKASGTYNDIVLVSNGLYTLTAEIVVNKAITVRGLTGLRDSIVDGNYPAVTTRCFSVSSGGVLEGLTIRKGYSTGSGGGVYLSAGTVSNCTLSENVSNTNSSSYGGGGVYCVNSSCMVRDSTLSSNAAYAGGGIYGGTAIGCTIRENWGVHSGGGAYGATLISNCTITANWAVNYYGGGLYACVTVVDSTIAGNRAGLLIPAGGGLNQCTLVRNCVISNNTAIGGVGGGAYNCAAIENSTIVGNSANGGGGLHTCANVRNCLIIGNTTTSWGGGTVGGGPYENCTIVRNRSGGYGGGVNGNVQLTNSIVYLNWPDNWYFYSTTTTNMFYGCTTPLPPGTNFSFDPGFVDSGSGYGTNDFVAGDYHLRKGSPCINVGTNAIWMTSGTDRDGKPRLHAGIVDLGAYEYAPRVIGSLIVIH